jgi:hypothetical protein
MSSSAIGASAGTVYATRRRRRCRAGKEECFVGQPIEASPDQGHVVFEPRIDAPRHREQVGGGIPVEDSSDGDVVAFAARPTRAATFQASRSARSMTGPTSMITGSCSRAWQDMLSRTMRLPRSSSHSTMNVSIPSMTADSSPSSGTAVTWKPASRSASSTRLAAATTPLSTSVKMSTSSVGRSTTRERPRQHAAKRETVLPGNVQGDACDLDLEWEWIGGRCHATARRPRKIG